MANGTAAKSLLMTTEEVAELYRCDEQTVVRYAKRGILPGFKKGSLWRFPRIKIEQDLGIDIESASRGENGSGTALPTGTD